MSLTKASLIRDLREASGLSYRQAAFCAGFLLEALAEGICRADRVELRGLGSFVVKHSAAKKVSLNSPAAVIPSHGRIVFRPCQKLRKSVWNRGEG